MERTVRVFIHELDLGVPETKLPRGLTWAVELLTDASVSTLEWVCRETRLLSHNVLLSHGSEKFN